MAASLLPLSFDAACVMPLEQFLHALEYANGATGIEPTVGRVIALLKEQQVTTTRRLAKLMVGRVGVSFCVICAWCRRRAHWSMLSRRKKQG